MSMKISFIKVRLNHINKTILVEYNSKSFFISILAKYCKATYFPY